MRMRYLACLAALGLAACEPAPPKAAATAEGEILPGSASDSMLPLDTVRSQAPLAPKVISTEAPDPAPPRAARSIAPSPAATAAPAPPEPTPEAVSED